MGNAARGGALNDSRVFGKIWIQAGRDDDNDDDDDTDAQVVNVF